ncbi:MAG TPA: hypothetical protein VGL82_20810 [Bryobacteraceae bacterium]|jgi:hypothetical protein
MNALLDLQDKLRTNTSAIGRLEMALMDHADSPVIQANLRSLRKLQSSLNEEFRMVASEIGVDVCSYRLLEDRPTARALAKVLAGFQDAFSTVYESLASGKPITTRRQLRPGTVEVTDLRVAYTFPGSFGIVLTVTRDQLLFEDWKTKADEAIGIVFDVARSRSAGEVSRIARQLGRAPVAALYSWAKANVQNKTGADVQWNTAVTKHPNAILVQYPEFEDLSHSIEETGEERLETLQFRGSLVGADTKTRRFHFVTTDDQDIRGKFKDVINESQQARLPSRYVATVEVRTKVNFATGDEDITYDLLKLAELS